MADQQSTSPLLGEANRPVSSQSIQSTASRERTPLLARNGNIASYGAAEVAEHDLDEHDPLIPSPATASLRSLQSGQGTTKKKRRWPTIVAVTFFGVVVVAIILGVFFAPAIVEEYAKESMVIEPKSLSINEITPTGVTARVQAVFCLDASKVKNKHVRTIGRLGTWIARKVESEKSAVKVFLPEYGNILLGTAAVPPIVVDIRNGESNTIDFLADLKPGDIDGIRQMANAWLEGRVSRVLVLGKANVSLKSGLISLGTQTVAESLVFEGNEIPSIPEYNITKLNFHEVPVSTNGRRGMGADVSLSLVNDYPIALSIPPLSFDILVANCGLHQPLIRLADATTDYINIVPYTDVEVDVGGIVRELPKTLTQECPHSNSSPLDVLLSDYLNGNDTTIFVRGSSNPSPETPDWVSAIMSSVTVPVPFLGHTFDKLIKDFTLTDSKFTFPGFFADEDDEPTISGNIVVTAGLPKEMNFGVNVTQVMADADVFYQKKKLGFLDLHKWQDATSELIKAHGGEPASLKMQSRIEKAPLHITDSDVLGSLVWKYANGDRIDLNIVARVNVKLETVLGELVVKDLPAEGMFPVNGISNGTTMASLMPKVGNLKILGTTKSSLKLQAQVNFTNPTEYSAEVGYFNIHILNNGSIIGGATARDIFVKPGNNSNILVEATWDPAGFGGPEGARIGPEFLSQYVSGYNTTLSFQVHKDSIPSEPNIGKALSNITVTIPTPRLSTPRSGDKKADGEPRFIDDATFHLFSSTAQFTLISPLKYSTLYVENINATAYYNHTEPIGRIEYDLPFKVSPGASLSPKLPVEWSLDSVGYEAVRSALGGKLSLDARGTVGIRLGRWSETIWYTGSGIGAQVRF
ncbi:hypothetical protein BJ878DRAFT_502197 [Calycina marina]|uniref:Pre-rrna processing protein n=1 Tax=Calycina marina TaxID=1763456 RepID=A0A9P7Z493_9HELO|nr:hypothetical protein BJ878DRAFT_502197 [Calycina marina]